MAGRPSTYTPELAAEICRMLIEGVPGDDRTASIRSICRLPDMPCRTTLANWEATIPEFKKLLTAAKEARADVDADSIVEIAREAALSKEAVAKARLEIDAVKWRSSKMNKKYADKVTLSGDEENPIIATITRRVVDVPKRD